MTSRAIVLKVIKLVQYIPILFDLTLAFIQVQRVVCRTININYITEHTFLFNLCFAFLILTVFFVCVFVQRA